MHFHTVLSLCLKQVNCKILLFVLYSYRNKKWGGAEVSVRLLRAQSTKCYAHTSQTEMNEACVRTMLEALSPLNLSSSGTSVATALCTKSCAAQLNPILHGIWGRNEKRGKANVTSDHNVCNMKSPDLFYFQTPKYPLLE